MKDERDSKKATTTTCTSSLYSNGLFGIRHRAAPSNLKFINATCGLQVCAIKDDYERRLDAKYSNLIKMRQKQQQQRIEATNKQEQQTTSILRDPKFQLNFDAITSNSQLGHSRKEQILPPIKYWTNQLLIYDDTRKWRKEMKKMINQIGIVSEREDKQLDDVAQDEEEDEDERERYKMKIKNGFTSKSVIDHRNERKIIKKRSTSSFDLQTTSPIDNSWKKTRMNKVRQKYYNQDIENFKQMYMEDISDDDDDDNDDEENKIFHKPPPPPAPPRQIGKTKFIINSDENERELWFIQILSQILKTQSMQEIQSWLVSSNKSGF
jgi:hypothetical protein